MPKHNESGCSIKAQTEFPHISGEGVKDNVNETYLTDRNIGQLKRMFRDEALYIKHMKTLWALRRAASEACEIRCGNGWTYDKTTPSFQIMSIANDFIGALSNPDIDFCIEGGKVRYYDMRKDKNKE